MKTQATPRPWKTGVLLLTPSTKKWSANDQARVNSVEKCRIYSNFSETDFCKGRTIVASCQHDYETREVEQANAELIVRAVNCHDELIEELELALSTVRTHAMQTYSRVSGEQAIRIEDLLKRAKGEV
jgi:hypothetical protein